MLTSLQQFVVQIFRHWLTLVFSIIFSATGAFNEWFGWPTPTRVWQLLAVGAFLVAIFLAFHDVRVDRDQLRERLRPKLSIVFLADKKPFFQEQHLLPGGQQILDRRFRIGIKNESDVPISNARVVLESCDPTQEAVHLEHSFAVMGHAESAGEFETSPGDVATAYVDVVCEQIAGALLYGHWFFCYAAQVSKEIPRVRYRIALRAEGGGTYARKSFVIEPDPNTHRLRMLEQQAE